MKKIGRIPTQGWTMLVIGVLVGYVLGVILPRPAMLDNVVISVATATPMFTVTPTMTVSPTITPTRALTATTTFVATLTATQTATPTTLTIEGVKFGKERYVGQDMPSGLYKTVVFWPYIMTTSASHLLFGRGKSQGNIVGKPVMGYESCTINTTGIAGVVLNPCYVYQAPFDAISFAVPGGIINDWKFFTSQIAGGPVMYNPILTKTPTASPKP